MEEISNIQLQVTTGLHQLPLGTIHVQSHGRAGSSHHFQTVRQKVHQGLIRSGNIDLHTQGVSGNGEFVHTHKCNLPGKCLQGCPGTSGVFKISNQGESKINSGKIQSQSVSRSTIQSGKSIHTVRSDSDQVHIHHIPRVEGHRCFGFLKTKGAINIEESTDSQMQGATGPEQLPIVAIHVESDGGCYTGGNFQFIRTKINQTLITGSQVDGDIQIVGSKGDCIHANKANVSGTGFEGGPGQTAVRLTGDQSQSKIQICEGKPQFIFTALMQAGKSGNAIRTNF